MLDAMCCDLVIFDCDGVLIDSEVISARMLVTELADYGVSIDLPYVTRTFLGRSYPTVLREVRTTFGVTLPDRFEADYRARLRETKDEDEKENCVRMVDLKRLAITANKLAQ